MKALTAYNPEYAVDEYGNVFSYKSDKYLAQVTNRKGYKRVGIRIGSKTKLLLVHRLVLEYFHRMPQGREEAHHRDGNINNNHISNLEWTTNRLHNDAHIHNRKRKLTGSDVLNIRTRRSQGEMIITLAKEYGVVPKTIRLIMANEIWKHITTSAGTGGEG